MRGGMARAGRGDEGSQRVATETRDKSLLFGFERAKTAGVRLSTLIGPDLKEVLREDPDQVRELFSATPARLKFMKSERAENLAVSETVKRLAMAHPEIAFSVTTGAQVPIDGGNDRVI